MARPRSVAAVEFSACGRDNAVGLTAILDRRQFFSGTDDGTVHSHIASLKQ